MQCDQPIKYLSYSQRQLCLVFVQDLLYLLYDRCRRRRWIPRCKASNTGGLLHAFDSGCGNHFPDLLITHQAQDSVSSS
jgi:hypothetical protein